MRASQSRTTRMEGWFASPARDSSSGAQDVPLRPGTVSVEQQLERVGVGRFQALTLAAFILVIMANDMERAPHHNLPYPPILS
jgi:hypothetical protein